MANIFTEWYQGISRSRGDSQGFSNLVNADIHSEIGFVSNQLALENDALSNSPNEPCIFAKTPNAVIYAFSTTSGKIWKLTSGTTWTSLTANTNGACCGVRYYNGGIFYATQTKLGRFVANTEASRYDTWYSFTQTSAFRPMEEVNLKLYIGNGRYVASVDSNTTFTDNALDLPANYTVSAIGASGVELLVGTIVGSQVNKCKVFLWDTFSDSWTVEDEIPEVSVNCFVKDDDTLFAQCGLKGQFYYWSGSAMVRFRKLPQDPELFTDVTTTICPYNTVSVGGRSLFASQGKVFSIHREDNDLPYALVQEYTTVSGNINALTSYGNQLIVSAGTNIQKTGTNYAETKIYTPEVAGNMDNVIVYYDSIGTGCSIGIATMIDNSGTYYAKAPIVDTIRKYVRHDGGLGDVNFMQAKITMTPSTTNKIKLRAIEIK